MEDRHLECLEDFHQAGEEAWDQLLTILPCLWMVRWITVMTEDGNTTEGKRDRQVKVRQLIQLTISTIQKENESEGNADGRGRVQGTDVSV